MTTTLLILLVLFTILPVYGQMLSDTTGLVNRLDVQAGGHSFEIKIVANFDISDYEFDVDEKKLTLYINSGLENNLGEVLVPQNLLSGNFTFYLNGQEFFPKVNSNDKISFITLNFTGSGNNTLDIFGTDLGMVEKELEPNPDSFGKGDALGDSLVWLALACSLAVAGAFTVIKIKKRKHG